MVADKPSLPAPAARLAHAPHPLMLTYVAPAARLKLAVAAQPAVLADTVTVTRLASAALPAVLADTALVFSARSSTRHMRGYRSGTRMRAGFNASQLVKRPPRRHWH